MFEKLKLTYLESRAVSILMTFERDFMPKAYSRELHNKYKNKSFFNYIVFIFFEGEQKHSSEGIKYLLKTHPYALAVKSLEHYIEYDVDVSDQLLMYLLEIWRHMLKDYLDYHNHNIYSELDRKLIENSADLFIAKYSNMFSE